MRSCGWPVMALGDVIEFFDSKRIPLNSSERQQRQGPYPYYGAQGVIDHIDDYIFDGDHLLIAEDGENLNSRKLPVALIARGKYWVNNHAHIVRGREGVADDRFLLHALNQLDLKPYITGAAQPKLSQANLRLVSLNLPPYPVQRRIASILSAYDDLIENNRKRIAILEDMARRLYREWFVHFRYPGHEAVPLVDSPPLGRTPQGWEIVPLNAAICLNPRPAPGMAPIPFIPMNCLSNNSMLIDGIEERDEPTGSRFQNGDTLLARITPCLENGKTAFVQCLADGQTACGSTEFIVMRSQRLSPEIVYLLARSDEFRGVAIKSMSGATGRQRVQEASLSGFQIACPPASVCSLFSGAVGSWFQLCENLHRQIQVLRRTRDLLLPRLMSGQLSVEAIAAAEAAVP